MKKYIGSFVVVLVALVVFQLFVAANLPVIGKK